MAIKFLAAVAGQAVHAGLFADEGALRQVVQNIVARPRGEGAGGDLADRDGHAQVVPNTYLTEDDIALFEDSPDEYVARDLESADGEPRRA